MNAATLTAEIRPEATSYPETLKEVIDTIPDKCYRRSTLRGLLLVARDLLLYSAAIVGLIIADSWWLVVPLWLATGLMVAVLFVLAHDAAHDALFGGKRLNSLVGRVLMLPSLHICAAWKLGHNHIHHRHTARQGLDFVWHPVTPEEYAAMGPLARLRHRLDWGPAGAGIYYLHRVWLSKMILLRRPPTRFAASIKSDRRLLWAFLVLAFVGTGTLGGLWSGDIGGAAWMFAKLVVIPFLVFCWLIGGTVYVHHIHPTMPWSTRRAWQKVSAQLSGTTVFRMPRHVDNFFHSIFVHVPHHVDPRIPCYHLRRASTAIEQAFPGLVSIQRLSVRRYLATTRACKLFDFETGIWHSYRSAAQARSA